MEILNRPKNFAIVDGELVIAPVPNPVARPRLSEAQFRNLLMEPEPVLGPARRVVRMPPVPVAPPAALVVPRLTLAQRIARLFGCLI